MNILFIVPSLSSGGAEKTVENMITYFRQYYPEYKLYECVMRSEGGVPDYVITLSFDSFGKDGKFEKIKNKVLQIRELRNLKKKLEIDISVSFLSGADIVNVLSKGDEKVILSLRNNPENILSGLNKVMQMLYKRSIIKADYIVALSKPVEDSAKRILAIDENKISTIYNPTPKYSEPCVPAKIKQLRIENKKIIITAGRLERQKGQWNLLKSFSLLRKKENNAVLLILGTGKLENELKHIAKELSIEDSVYFMGFVSNASEYIKYSDIFVFTSLFEGLGNVLIEALSLQKAIISTDCFFGPRDILAPGTFNSKLEHMEIAQFGILVPIGDTNISSNISEPDEVLCEAMETLLTNDNLRIEYEEKTLIRAKDFEPHKIMQEWKNLFDKLYEGS